MRQRKLREGKKYSPRHTAWAEAEAVGESRVLPGGHGWKLQGGLLLCDREHAASLSEPGVGVIAKPTF